MSKRAKVKIEYVSGVEGNALYINDYRIAGPKPYDGGKVLYSWTAKVGDILESLKPFLLTGEPR